MSQPKIQSFSVEPNLSIVRTIPDHQDVVLHTHDDNFEAFLSESYRRKSGRYVGLNIVHTTDFRLTDEENSSFGISSALDRRILRFIRSQADAVFMGAATIRNEGWVLPKNGAPAAILVGNSPLELPKLLERAGKQLEPPYPIYVFASSRVYREQQTLPFTGIKLFEVADDLSKAVPQLIQTMHQEGYERLICEGGVIVAEAALHTNSIDELAVTVSPISSQGSVRIRPDFTDGFKLVQEFSSEDGFIFQRWQRT